MAFNRSNDSFAFIFYRPGEKGAKEQISYSAKVMPILFPLPLEGGKPPIFKIASLCSRWRKILDRRQKGLNGNGTRGDGGAGYIDTLKSWRRCYAVRGVLLSSQPGAYPGEGESYLFTLERLASEGLDLNAGFRHWNLSPREQEITRLILDDLSNKEIAKHIGISINTIKGYMKLLMRKVGVHNRAGIVSVLLTGKKNGKKKGEDGELSPDLYTEEKMREF